MALAEPVKIGFWNAELERRGPGLFLRDALRSEVEDIRSARQDIDRLGADILVLSGLDFDADGAGLAALNDGLSLPYPYLMALRPNSGVPSGHDLDGDGRTDGPADAWSFGFFPGNGGMAILSRHPFDLTQAADFTPFLWRDLPGNRLPFRYAAFGDHLPLSSRGHHVTGITLADGSPLTLLTWHATTPAFDSEADENGSRNHDETAFWTHYLAGALGAAPPRTRFVVIGQANVDPVKGDGDPAALVTLLEDPRLQDPLSGDTVDFGKDVGPLRVSYILPSRDLTIAAAGVAGPALASRHRAIWVQLDF